MMIEVMRNVFAVDPKQGPYAALYMRYRLPCEYHCDTAEEAAAFLDNGDGAGEMAGVAIVDTASGHVLCTRKEYLDSPDWITLVAIEGDTTP